eukprot:5945815-Lingulodinium_polyedra.AAC.1
MWRRGLEGEAGDDIARAFAVIERFEEAADWQLNGGKSCQFANTAALRRWLRASGGGDSGVHRFQGPWRRAPPVAPA